MKPELAEEIFALIGARAEAQPTPMEFEMAYQARIAIDRIRFAIKHTEQFGPHTDQMRDAGLQLLDALQRLESVDRRFQGRSRVALDPEELRPGGDGDADGENTQSSNQANGRDRTQRHNRERSE